MLPNDENTISEWRPIGFIFGIGTLLIAISLKPDGLGMSLPWLALSIWSFLSWAMGHPILPKKWL